MPTEKEIVVMYVSLDDDQHRVMSYWHRRTAMLWNAVVAHVGDYVNTYIGEPPSPESDATMEKIVDAVYATITGNSDSLVEDFILDDKWVPMVAKIKELPRAVADQRLRDLKRGYLEAKHRILLDGDAASCAPSMKSIRSNHSVRLTSEFISIADDELTIHGPHGLTIKHEEFRKIHIAPNTVLSITRRRVRPSVREAWKLERNKRPYSLTFITG